MQKPNKSETLFLECACHSDEHTLKFLLDDDEEVVELSTSVFLSQYHNFFGRILIAFKYIFGYTCKYGHWDCFLFKDETVDNLITLLNKYKELKEKEITKKSLRNRYKKLNEELKAEKK